MHDSQCIKNSWYFLSVKFSGGVPDFEVSFLQAMNFGRDQNSNYVNIMMPFL
jgi:hypothetical protein